MQKDIWQPGSIVLHVLLRSNKMYFARKCSSFALLASLGDSCSRSTLLYLFWQKAKRKEEKMSNLLHSKMRLGTYLGRQEHDLYFLN